MAFGLGGIIGAITGVKGLFDAFNGNNKANQLQSQAVDAQERQLQLDEQQAKREEEFRQQIMALYGSLEKLGMWDAAARGQRIKNEVGKEKETGMANTAAALKTMGYKPGDSVSENAVERVGAASDLKLADQIDQLYTRLPMEQMAFMQGFNPVPFRNNGGIGAAAGGFSQLAQIQRQNTPDVSAAVASILPFLQGNKSGDGGGGVTDWLKSQRGVGF